MCRINLHANVIIPRALLTNPQTSDGRTEAFRVPTGQRTCASAPKHCARTSTHAHTGTDTHYREKSSSVRRKRWPTGKDPI